MENDSTSQMLPPLGVIDSQGSNKTAAHSQWRVPGVCNHPWGDVWSSGQMGKLKAERAETQSAVKSP